MTRRVPYELPNGHAMQATSHPDTIVAVSSPPSRAARGLIRISGADVDRVLAHLLDDASLQAEPRVLTPVRLKRPAIPALLLRFVPPASYTGDDLAELQLPGNAALLDRVLHDAINTPGANARLAEPGEFTFRAYAAGKIDLTQAEGIGATISAISDSQLAAAAILRRGKLGQLAHSLVDQLGNLLALVEAGIDFTDQDDVTPIAPPELNARLAAVAAQLDALLARSRSWGAIESLPRVVLVGPPSAGKSTLFNALLNKERAVIDPTPGTTRDALAEPLQLVEPDGRRAEVMLVDLAGLDENLAGDALQPDLQAQAVVRSTIGQADLLLRVSDDPASWTSLQTTSPTINVLTKCDTDEHAPNSPHRKMGVQTTTDPNPHLAAGALSKQPSKAILVSAHTGEGLNELRTAITHALTSKAVSLRGDLLALQPRHEHAINHAAAALQETRELINRSSTDRLPDIELLADAMRSALDALASLGGRLTPDEVIGRVFATFCVGK